MEDRVNFVPRHSGLLTNALPNDPLFLKLLSLAHSKDGQKPIIRDVKAGVVRNVRHLLNDVLQYMEVIKLCVPSQTLQSLSQGDEVFISVCAPGGYEFSVAILAILAIGASVSLLSPLQPIEELEYYISKTLSVAIACSTGEISSCQRLERKIHQSGHPNFVCIPVQFGREQETSSLPQAVISSDRQPDPNGTGIAIFTSGTTGPPKAVALRRATITTGAQFLAAQMRLQTTDTILHQLPVHHATGVCLSFFPFLQAGACIEFNPRNFDPEWTWGRWRQGDITHFTGVPTIYMRLMRHWEQKLSQLPWTESQAYQNGLSNVKVMFCGTSALPKPVEDFWRIQRSGRRITQRYGSTETQITMSMPIEDDDDVPDGSVGTVAPGVEVKLSEGNTGELLIKSPFMFSKYVNDPEATKSAHDENGYYKTGDIAKKEGKYYFILGRASIDILKSGGYKISALDIEREIAALPYIDEVIVVGAPDDEYGQRVAAAVTLKQPYLQQGKSLNLADLRADLRSRLAGYKLPTVLRVVTGELPKNATGKVVKKTLGPEYFPANYRTNPEVQFWLGKRQLSIKL